MIQKWVGVGFSALEAAIVEELIKMFGLEWCKECFADPIETASGAQMLSHELLSLQGALPLSFTINYNSLLLVEGDLGRSWTTHNAFNTRLRE